MSKTYDNLKIDRKHLDSLQSFGLTKPESIVYAVLLHTGGGSVNDIAEYSSLKRTTTYSILDNLIKYGLAGYQNDGFKRKVVPENPDRLNSILEEKKLKIQESLPSFQSLFNLKGRTDEIKQYKGLDAIKPLYNKLISEIRPHEDYYVLSNQEKWLELDETFFEDFSERRGKLPINLKMVLEDNKASRRYYNKRHIYNAHIRFLPKGVVLKTNLVITPKRTLVQQLVEPIIALEIENQSFIEMHQEMYRLIWNSLPDVPEDTTNSTY